MSQRIAQSAYSLVTGQDGSFKSSGRPGHLQSTHSIVTTPQQETTPQIPPLVRGGRGGSRGLVITLAMQVRVFNRLLFFFLLLRAPCRCPEPAVFPTISLRTPKFCEFRVALVATRHPRPSRRTTTSSSRAAPSSIFLPSDLFALIRYSVDGISDNQAVAWKLAERCGQNKAAVDVLLKKEMAKRSSGKKMGVPDDFQPAVLCGVGFQPAVLWDRFPTCPSCPSIRSPFYSLPSTLSRSAANPSTLLYMRLCAYFSSLPNCL